MQSGVLRNKIEGKQIFWRWNFMILLSCFFCSVELNAKPINCNIAHSDSLIDSFTITYSDSLLDTANSINVVCEDSLSDTAKFKQELAHQTELQEIIDNADVIYEVGKLLWKNRDLAKRIYKSYPDLLVIKGYYPSFGYQYQGSSVLELGVVKGKRDLLKPLTFSEWRLSAGYYFLPTSSPNFSFNLVYGKSAAFYTYSISAQTITAFNEQSTYAIRPEVGLSILGSWSLTYGYSIFLNNNYLNLPNSVFTLRYTRQNFRKNIIKKRDEVLRTLIVDYPKFVKLGLDIKKMGSKK
jgi:hypothetical protein